MEDNKKKIYLSNFVLKIIAIISMTIDHLAVFLYSFNYINDGGLYDFLRVIGRIALPIFIFLLIEGLRNTKNIHKYMLRLGIMAALIYIAILFINSPLFNIGINAPLDRFGNIFIDLFMLALTYFLFTRKNKIIKALSVLPILYIIGMSLVKYFSISLIPFNQFHYLYDGLYPQYDFISLTIFLGIFLGYFLTDKYVNYVLKNDKTIIENYKKTSSYQFNKNASVLLVFIILSVIYYLIGKYSGIPNLNAYMNYEIETYIVLGGLFILFYSGKLGLNNKYIQGAFYLYYPLHIVIIFLIFLVISYI